MGIKLTALMLREESQTSRCLLPKSIYRVLELSMVMEIRRMALQRMAVGLKVARRALSGAGRVL
jgi:hypothetical protein